MRRRRFLLASALGLSSVAGCTTNGGAQGADTSTGKSPTTTARTSPPSQTTTGLPVPEPASGVFDGVECPSFDDAADRSVCYHEVDPAGADVVLSVEPEVFDPSPGDGTVETLEFTMYNRSRWHFHLGPYDWGIERYEDGEWVHVAPDTIEPLEYALPSGETNTWELPSAPHPSPMREAWTVLDVALRPGLYAFNLDGSFARGGGGTTTRAGSPPDERVEFVGLFRVERTVDPGGRSGTATVSPDGPNVSG